MTHLVHSVGMERSNGIPMKIFCLSTSVKIYREIDIFIVNDDDERFSLKDPFMHIQEINNLIVREIIR